MHLKHRPSSDQSGVVTLEFAVIAPVLALMIIGAFDLARAYTTLQQVEMAAQWIAVSAQTLAAQPTSANSTTTSLSPAQAKLAISAFYGAMPQVVSGLYGGKFGAALSEVSFPCQGGACPGTGTYVPQYDWTAPLGTLDAASVNGKSNYDSGFKRVCGTAPTATNTVPWDRSILSSIPSKSIQSPSTIIVADVYYQYKPVFYKFVTGPIDFYASVSFPNLIGQTNATVVYDGNVSDGVNCNPTPGS